jgi:two-component sensor histidine kinase/CheY-like chemotaxis protein
LPTGRADAGRRAGLRSFRSRLFRLVLIAAVPFVLLWLSLLVWVALSQRDQVFQGIQETGRALQMAIDRELLVTQASMDVLARSHLFHAFGQPGEADSHAVGELQETVADIAAARARTLFGITVFAPDGRAIAGASGSGRAMHASMDSLAPPRAVADAPGAPDPERDFLARAASGESFITDLLYDAAEDAYVVAVGTPVFEAGALVAVIVAKVLPSSLTAVLEEQDLEVGTIAALVDRHGAVVARTRDIDRFLGGLAADDLVAFARDPLASSALLRTHTMDFVPIYASFRRLATAPYVVSFAAPRAAVDAPLRQGLLLGGLGGLIALAAFAGIARRLGLRLGREVSSLADDADALGRGETVPDRPETVREVARVREALRAGTHSLAEREERLRLAVEGTGMATWDIHLPTLRLVAGPRFWAMLGIDPPGDAAASIDAWRRVVHRDDLAAFDETFAAAAEGRPFRRSLRVRREKGGPSCWIEALGRLSHTRQGETHLIGVAFDVTERMAADENRRLLMDEVDHRAKNALAVVHALVRLTPPSSPDAFAAAVEGRIRSLASAHDLLASVRWSSAGLGDILRAELAAQIADGSVVVVDAPDVSFAPSAVQPLTMVLHELATNAMKYGALSRLGGRVTIAGGWEEGGAFWLSWSEAGGPPLDGAPDCTGFGSYLIRATVERQLHGTVEFRWEGEGLCCRITIVGRHLTRADAAAPAHAPAEVAPVPEAALRGARVLVVEDEVLLADDLCATLRGFGCEVVGPATDLPQAEELVQTAGRLDAAILDINIRGKPVLPLAERLLANGVPVIYTTGYAVVPDSVRDRPGVVGVLSKPVGPDDLQAAMARGVAATPS